MIDYVEVDGLGSVRVQRRKGSRSIRISVSQNGAIKLSMPYRTSITTGIEFLQQKRTWIQKHASSPAPKLGDGARIGKAHTLLVSNNDSSKSRVTLTDTTIMVRLPANTNEQSMQPKLIDASKKALQREAQNLLPKQLEVYAQKYNYRVASVSVKPLQSRWGSCSNKNDIVLNTFLIQLPWQFIDYVILHELAHTLHHNHSSDFWNEVALRVPAYKDIRHTLKKFPTAVFDSRHIEHFVS